MWKNGVDTNNEMNDKGICEVLEELKFIQDYINNFKTKYFGSILLNIIGTDTVPFLVFTNDGLLKLQGVYRHESSFKEECFVTSFFRIEEIDHENCCARISLLVPLGIYGNVTDSHCDVMMLRKTSTCITINLDDSCGIQLLDTELLKRDIIIEPKW
jgi:hypothetical protein